MFSTLSLYDVTERSDIKYYHRGKALAVKKPHPPAVELFCLQEAASQKKFGLNGKGRENKDRV